MDTAYIYTLSDPRTNEVRYVGKTFGLKQRYSDHVCTTSKINKKTSWVLSLKKSGHLPIMEVIEKLENVESNAWESAEKFWIETLKFYGCRLVNGTSGGDSGKRMSAESIQKRVDATRGRKHTEEHKEKIRIACTLRMTPEEKARLSAKLKGRKTHTEEFKKMMSQLKTGVARGPYINIAREAGRDKWKLDNGIKPERRCVHCKGVIKYNFLKSGIQVPDLHFFTEGIGYIHNKCKKKLHLHNQ